MQRIDQRIGGSQGLSRRFARLLSVEDRSGELEESGRASLNIYIVADPHAGYEKDVHTTAGIESTLELSRKVSQSANSRCRMR